MPIATSYTEAELAAFAIVQLDTLAAGLTWTVGSPAVLEAVTDTLLAYGVTNIVDATNIPRLRALARVAIWRAVARATTGWYRFGADQMSFDRGQVHEHALAMIAEAERDAGAVGAGPALVVATVVRDSDSDPYAAHPSQWGGTGGEF